MSTRYLFLTGGLGNQLFQYSALCSYSGDKSLIIDVVNGNPRINIRGEADLLEFGLGENVLLHKRKMSLLLRKAVGYSLRSSLNPGKVERIYGWRLITCLATSLLLSFHHRKLIIVGIPKDLGDDDNFDKSARANYLIGYFQSTRWAQTLKSKADTLKSLDSDSPQISMYRDLSALEKPLVVHVRLGDYLAEGGFGIPGRNYYQEAISSMLLDDKFKRIWLFSDEPEKAITYLPEELGVSVRVIEPLDLSTAETLQIMRYGHGYVIGNSTFSWWGAFLSHSKNPRVYYPYPWFKDHKAPKNLMPKEWEGLNAQF
jgi:hypothetical protein